MILAGFIFGCDANSNGCDTENTDSDNLLVTLEDGTIQGDALPGARRFLKIPYAKPPVGELRWTPPVPNDPWRPKVLHETEFAENCPQLQDMGSPASNNEDCLYLNVWTPDPAPAKAPVMVWIHGGGNFSGGSGIPIPITDQLWYDGQYFAANNDVVVVTFNYRLGPLGFMAHPGLAEEDHPLGNQGLLDQRLVLEWVRKNIAEFGGDPSNVTIFGESAGSADVCYHMASPGSRGLFHRAVSQSGGCTFSPIDSQLSAESTGTQMTAFGKALGCPAGEDQLQCMRNVSVADILAKSNQPIPGDGSTTIREGDYSFEVVVDGMGGFLPESPRSLFKKRELAKVPYLLGTNNDEGTLFVLMADRLRSDAAYQADLAARFGESKDDVYALYPPSDYNGDVNAARVDVITDSMMLCSTHDTARMAAEAGLDVYMYNFNIPWSIAPNLLKAAHSSEISHVFGHPFVPVVQRPGTDQESQAQSKMIADAMNTYWANFARSGDPNYPGAPAQWPLFSPDNDRRLQFDPDWKVLTDYRAEKCTFWRNYYNTK